MIKNKKKSVNDRTQGETNGHSTRAFLSLYNNGKAFFSSRGRLIIFLFICNFFCLLKKNYNFPRNKKEERISLVCTSI